MSIEGHNQLCYYCSKPCNSLHGNPNLWPIPLCHADDPGRVKWHHIGCVAERLHELESLRQENSRLREALQWYADAKTYIDGEYGYQLIAPINCDNGEKARLAIAALEQKIEELALNPPKRP